MFHDGGRLGSGFTVSKTSATSPGARACRYRPHVRQAYHVRVARRPGWPMAGSGRRA